MYYLSLSRQSNANLSCRDCWFSQHATVHSFCNCDSFRNMSSIPTSVWVCEGFSFLHKWLTWKTCRTWRPLSIFLEFHALLALWLWLGAGCEQKKRHITWNSFTSEHDSGHRCSPPQVCYSMRKALAPNSLKDNHVSHISSEEMRTHKTPNPWT